MATSTATATSKSPESWLHSQLFSSKFIGGAADANLVKSCVHHICKGFTDLTYSAESSSQSAKQTKQISGNWKDWFAERHLQVIDVVFVVAMVTLKPFYSGFVSLTCTTRSQFLETTAFTFIIGDKQKIVAYVMQATVALNF